LTSTDLQKLIIYDFMLLGWYMAGWFFSAPWLLITTVALELFSFLLSVLLHALILIVFLSECVVVPGVSPFAASLDVSSFYTGHATPQVSHSECQFSIL
jgi:hypothetical protein